MNDRQRILAAIRGETPDRMPFVPRLEFWYRARRLDQSLSPDLRSLTLMEIADRLGVAYYAVCPDFTDYSGDEMVDRPLGIVRQSVLPFDVLLEDVDRRVLSYGRRTVVEYHTPVGSIHTACAFTDEMIAAGASDPYVTEHAIRSLADFEVVGYIFSHLKVAPRTAGYQTMRERVGDRGIVVAFTSSYACPIQHILTELMPMDQFYYALHDCPSTVERLAEQMEPYYQAIKAAAAESPAEVVVLGSNYDETLTPPPFFRKYLLDPLRNYADLLHRRGKFLMTHTDGENRLLLSLYREAGFDVADSLCPYPMTRCRLEEIREAFADRITIWGGIPSILLCPDKTSLDEFKRFIDNLLARYGHQSHFVLGVSDMVTADADWDRVRYIADSVSSLIGG
ncbi:MAG: uroporphyrinogen decarboxylase family protein [Terriglobia bacterium]|jgi:uroporphyrinogen-III decarboxylase